MARNVFYSFHYQRDAVRASQVRNIGTVEGNKPARDNDWETVKRGGDLAIKRWINAQLKGRSCCVVLIGKETAGRKWINYEIEQAWNSNMGVVGLRIHGLKNLQGYIDEKGGNPFTGFTYGKDKKRLSNAVPIYNPQGNNSKDRYAWIRTNLAAIVEKGIEARKNT